MSAIFISHSSRDAEVAAEIRRRLTTAGHRSVFLDFDPADGIPAGRDWEQELYAQLRACRAVIVICSRASMASDWVFAEITHARALGKPVFAVRVDDSAVRSLLTDTQMIDLTADPKEAFERLELGLRRAGLDPASAFDWDGTRPPYPGLLAFDEADAAIFFGRNKEIGEGLSLVQRLRRFGGSRWALILGASGSGKSSLMRAGLLPRLRRDNSRWTIVGPLRPRHQAFLELARAFSDAFSANGDERSVEELGDALTTGSVEERSARLVRLGDELRAAGGQAGSNLLLVVDQLEESLADGDGASEATRFLATLRHASEGADSKLFVLATLRSDFLAALQNHSALRDMAFGSLPVGPMSIAGFSETIEGPAALAGIDIESGLVQALVADSETDDALPLLAFTLRELWEGAPDRQHLTASDYRERLGGLHGAVARAADTALGTGSMGAKSESVLRSAFLALARIDDEGNYVRQTVAWSKLPNESHAVLERFIKARLLIAHGSGEEKRVEVAHEALLRVWRRLVGWLTAARALLAWRRRLKVSEKQWRDNGRRAGYLLRGPALGEAVGWMDRRPELLGDKETVFIRTSARAERWRRYRLVAFFAVVGVALAIFALRAHQQRERAEKLRVGATDISKLSAARRMRQMAPATPFADLVAERASRALVGMERPEGFLQMLDLDQLGPSVLAISPDLMMVVLRTGKGAEARLVTERRWRSPLPHPQPVTQLLVEGEPAQQGRGRRVLSATSDGIVRLWQLPSAHALIEANLQQGDLQRVERLVTASSEAGLAAELIVAFDGHSGGVDALLISPDAEYGASLSGGEVGVWRLAGGVAPLVLHGHQGRVNSAVFSPDSDLLVTAGDDRQALVYELDDLLAPPRPLRGHQAEVLCAAVDAESRYVLTAAADREVRQWARDGQGVVITTLDCDPVEMKYANTPGLAAIACQDGTARILDLTKGESRVLQ